MMGSALRLVFHVNKIISQKLLSVQLFCRDLHDQVFLVLVMLRDELLILLCGDVISIFQSISCLLAFVQTTCIKVL